MFNEDDVTFILESAKKDLESIQSRISDLSDTMAEYGKRIVDLKKTEEKIQAIVDKATEALEDRKGDK